VPAPDRRSEGDVPAGEGPVSAAIAELRQRFLDAMDDDFNTGGAIGVLFDLLRRLNKLVDDEKLEDPKARDQVQLTVLRQGARTLREVSATLGLFRKPPLEKGSPAGDDALTARLLDLLVEVRADARKARDFAAADKVRNRLAELGIALEDHPSGTQWSIP